MRAKVRSGRGVDRSDSFMLEQFADAEDVVGIAHGHATAQAVGAHNDGDADRRLRRIAALSLCDEAALGDSMFSQVIAAHSPFAEYGIGSSSTRGNDDRRYSAMKEIEGVIKAGFQYRRGTTGVFRCSENHNGGNRMDLPGGGGNDDPACGNRK